MIVSPLQQRPEVKGFFHAVTNTVSYVIHDPATKVAAIIDPVLDFQSRSGRISTESADALLDEIAAKGLKLAWLLETHAHADHLSAGYYLRNQTGAPLVIGANITETQSHFAALFEADDVALDGSAFDRLINDGDVLPLGELAILAMHTPGHTAACITYVVGDAAFVGDTLFMPDFGTARADFPGGDAATLYRSIQAILALPDETRLFTGHDYPAKGRVEPQWETSVAAQRSSNVHIHAGIDEAQFVAMRSARDATLDPPQLILPALQVNIRAGNVPPRSSGGHVYLRVPVVWPELAVA
jgi:glyoxylase-like metal-dependent hydrolase (beta-lactamase superfamily II)